MNAPVSRWDLAFYFTLVIFMVGGIIVGGLWVAWVSDVMGYVALAAGAFAAVYVAVYRLIGEQPRRGFYPYAPPPPMPPSRATDYLGPIK